MFKLVLLRHGESIWNKEVATVSAFLWSEPQN